LPPNERSRSSIAIISRSHVPSLTSLDARNVLVQPRNLDPGPGVLVSMLELARRDPDATVAMFPSDHYVRDGDAFRQSIARMCRVVAAVPERIALLGAHPERADGGYGYITPGRRLVPGADTSEVRASHEKPAAGVAAEMIRRAALWNSLVMVARVRRVLELLRTVRPAEVALLEDMAFDVAALATVYDRLQPWNFSQGFPHACPSTWSSRVPATLAGAIGARPKRSSDRSQPSAWCHRGEDASTLRETVMAPLRRTRWR
jgi:mannose-1-phosphate guanylyltransferase